MKDNPAQIIHSYAQYFAETGAVYRNALPHFNNGVIDFTTLSSEGSLLAYELLESMLAARNFSKEVSVDFQVDEELIHLYFESRNAQKNKGQQVLGLGYPLLISQQDNELVSLPLFIWPLTLESFKKQGVWKFEYQTERPVQLNPYFPYFMRTKYGMDIEPDLQEYFGSKIDAEKLALFCNHLASSIQLEITSQQVSLTACPGTNELDCFTEQGALQWSGVLGNFPFLPTENNLKNLNEYLVQKPVELTNHDFGTEWTDPWQASAAAMTKNNFITLVEGPSATGKTHLLRHLASNALANEGKCLIVSSHIAALKAIQQSFASYQFDELLLLLRDEITDKVLLSELIKARAKGKFPAATDMPKDLRISLDRMQRKKESMEARYRASRKKVFGDNNWAETLGLFLEASQLEPKELLNSHLDEQDFHFNETELEQIIIAIAEAPGLFNTLGTLNHPLTTLNSGIFLHYDEKESLDFIKKTLQKFTQKATVLQHQFIRIQNEYSESLKNHYSQYFHDLRNIALDLKDKISDYSSQFGEELRKSGKGTLKLYGIFSDKFKQALAYREDIFVAYEALQNVFAKHLYFEHHFEKTDKNIDKIAQNMEGFSEHLQNWWRVQNEAVKDELLRLTHKTAHPHLNFSERLKQLEEDMEAFVDELNESGLYQLPFQCNTLTLPRKQKFLEDKMSLMEQTAYHLRDFHLFYPWQKFWFSQDTLTRKVIKALGRVNPGNWEAAFKSWYFNEALSKAYDPDLPVEDYDLVDYREGNNAIITRIPEEIRRIWSKRRVQKADALRKAAENISTNNLSLKEMFHHHAEVITDLLPIFLTTPQMATRLFQAEKLFDFLLIDEAQSECVETCVELFPLAKRVVVFTTREEEEKGYSALPQFLRQNVVKPCVLQHFYAPRAADILRTEAAPDIDAVMINGRFEEELNANADEADKVIHLLNTIEKTSVRTYPSVGIVCLTVPQRDLISTYLLRIKQRRQTGFETIQQLERNGLGVFHIDELSGHLFDLVILSATFGETGVKNKLTGKINVLNTPAGIAGMHKLMGCAKNKLHIIHSIPQSSIESFLEQPTQEGTFLLSALLRGKRLAAPHLPEVREGRETWEAQLERLLRKEKPEAYFRKQDGFLVMHDPAKERDKLLLTDGCFAQTDNTDFSWEYDQRIKWETEHGIDVVPVWSVMWR
ncbi:MAG: hypothetical protein KDC85_07020 [Saprospiraceae bacterium]|nr:hypothetical protein [Saprospiraceae bacterium]MCB9323723.1 hypothetical protein [Lewinellaceae bacterium]